MLAGTPRISGDEAAAIIMGATLTGGTTGSVLFVGAGPVLSQDNNNFFWDNTNKRLGINTNNPVTMLANTAVGTLDQSGTGVSASGFAWATANAGYVSVLNNSNNATNAQGLFAKIMGTSASNRIITLNANGTDVMVVQGNGNVGIGTTNPVTTLDIAGNNALTNGTAIRLFNSNASNTNKWILGTGGSTIPNDAFSIGDNTGYKMTILSNGNVGIGTTNPQASLTISSQNGFSVTNTGGGVGTQGTLEINRGSQVSPASSRISFGTDGTGWQLRFAKNMSGTYTDLASLQDNGNFGIGTTTPSSLLSVGSNSNFQVNTAGKVVAYNNIATVSNGVPAEYATVDLTAQQAAITATTIYTPAATGLFRLSVYLQVTQAATTSSILGGASGVVITYNDGDGNVAQSDTLALATTAGAIATTSSGNTTTTNLSGTFVLYARTGVAIQYAIGYTSVGATPMQYAAHLKVEAL